MTTKPTIIWDAGGVIYAFDQSRTDRKLSANSGRTVEEISAVLFGSSAGGREYNAGLVEQFNLGKIDSNAFYDAVKKALGLTMTFDEFHDAWTDIFTLNKGIVGFIQDAHRAGYKQGVLSSTNPMHWGKMNSMFDLEALLGKDHVVCTYHPDAGQKKPHPALFEATLRRLRATAPECIYVDDVQKYADAAEKLGIKGVHVDITQQDFQEKCIEDLGFLLEFWDKI